MSNRLLAVVAAGWLFVAAIPQHPNHDVLVDRLQGSPADTGKYLQVQANGRVAPTPGAQIPIFVWNVSLNANNTGGLRLTRDATTGVLTLPSAPNPPESLDLEINGLGYIPGISFTVNGTQVTPATAAVKDEFINAFEIRAKYIR